MRFTGFFEDNPDRAVLGVTRSATAQRWRARLDAVGEAQAALMGERHEINGTVARVMAARGVMAEEAVAFLDPTLKRLLPDPSTLTGMDAAAQRLADGIRRGERIALFGDYDVDGATSVALTARYLRHFGLDPLIHIPDRLIEGYGPNAEAIRALREKGATLLVTLDCGSTSLDILGGAARAGLDIVVIDHHQCGVELPEVRALVNPNRQDDLSGQGHLCAAGVAFLVLVAVNRDLRRLGMAPNALPDLMGLLDLVALGTVADVVPLKGLNRAFVVQGLKVAQRRGNPGLAALGAVARLSGPVSPYHLGFMIGPRINAGGRIGDAGLGTRLLATDDPLEAERIAAQLDGLNKERQAIETEMLRQAEEEVGGSEPGPVIVTGSDRWHPGVVGLIASRLKEKWRRPAFAISFDRGPTGTGSGRSIAGVDLGGAVRAAVAAGLLVKGGGHAMAAGLTIDRPRMEEFTAFLTERLAQRVEGELARSDLDIDGVLTAGGANLALMAALDKAGPYGSGHPEPVFAFPAHRVSFADEVGQKHVRLTLAAGDGSSLKAIAFKAAGEDLGHAILKARGTTLHVAGCLSLDHWQGEARVQLRVLDVADAAKRA